MTPTIDGKTYLFGHRGLYNGLSVLGDAETGSYWDHVTGKCLKGPLEGRSLEIAPLLHMTAEQAARLSDILLARSEPTLFARAMGRIAEWTRLSKRGFFPPGFRRTMASSDPRLPEMELGLGVWTGRTQIFYPMTALRAAGGQIVDSLEPDYTIEISIDSQTGIPSAIATGQSLNTNHGLELKQRPMQLFTRWYGFSFTFPNCGIYRSAHAEK